jgi:enoyl-CoA hydratase
MSRCWSSKRCEQPDSAVHNSPEVTYVPSSEFQPATDELLYQQSGAVVWLTFNRPAARNAMTWAMYQGLYDACEHVEADERVQVLVLRGAGDKAFVSGTDIAQFRSFATADDALEYERSGARYVGRLEALSKATIAMIQGYCAGAGAAIATACDLRLAAPSVRFGVPIARTLGNTLSTENFARLIQQLGAARTKELLFTGRFIEADEGRAIGLFQEIVPEQELQARVQTLAEQIAANAPLTIRATKQAVNRIVAQGPSVNTDDLILLCYLSRDFEEGVDSFLAKRQPRWEGR